VVGTVVWLVVGVKGRVVVVAFGGVVLFDVPLFAPAPWAACGEGVVVDVVALREGCSVVTVTEAEALAALASWAKLLMKNPVIMPAPMKII
jgi:hypothetical protein